MPARRREATPVVVSGKSLRMIFSYVLEGKLNSCYELWSWWIAGVDQRSMPKVAEAGTWSANRRGRQARGRKSQRPGTCMNAAGSKVSAKGDLGGVNARKEQIQDLDR